MLPRDPAVLARFLSSIEFVPHGCWEWNGYRDRGGYGRFNYESKKQSAHRLANKLFREPIPEGLTLDHLCRNRACVNPWHLEAVTHAENVARGRTGKHWSERTHCANGHEYTAENTRWKRCPKTNALYRICRECVREAGRRWRERQAA